MDKKKEDRKFSPKMEVFTKLPTLNEYINVERTNKFAAASMKKKFTDICSKCAIVLKNKINPEGLYDLKIDWVVENNKIDSDNIFFGQKFLIDGIVKSGALKGDGRKYIRNIYNTIETNKKYKVTVTLIEL